MLTRLATAMRRWLGRVAVDFANGTLKAFLIFAILLMLMFVSKADAQSIFADGFEEGRGGGPPPDFCDHPLVSPAGFTPVLITWQKLFTPRDGNPKPTYPNSLGFPVPIGAEKGTYTAAKLTALPNQNVSMFWDPAQAKPSEGYFKARPALGMWIAISECPGDFRVSPGCAKFANTGSLIWSTRITQSTPSACAVVAGEDYFITVAPYDPRGPLRPENHTCSPTPSSEQGCDIQARSTSN
jgi:hypothetical protein